MANELFLPIVNLASLDYESPSARRALVNLIMDLCQTRGMFQVKNHGISVDVLKNAMTSAMEFFELPNEELGALAGIESSKCMLYTSSYAHALGMAKPPLYWRDALQLNLDTEVIGDDGWPNLPQSFRPNVWEFATSVELVEGKILSIISEGLGLDETYFDGGLCRDPYIIVNGHPTCPRPTRAIGMPQHCDPGVLTISLLGDVPGTQVYENGEWINVRPDKNNLVVTVGHQLQVVSNGALKAPIHRELVNGERARTTISRVSQPSGDYVVGPARELTRTNPPKYKSFKYEEYLEHHVLEYKETCSILDRYYSSS